jgi:hypothetical protein
MRSTVASIVLDMHRFGAASLHQLRGRVGRRNTEARAYLLHPPLATLADKTTSRLAALREILELGSGWSLSVDDMERRGAGNPLGTQQKGKSGWEGVDANEFERIVEEAMRAKITKRIFGTSYCLPVCLFLGCCVDLRPESAGGDPEWLLELDLRAPALLLPRARSLGAPFLGI